jgi:hypothetical protein
LFRGRAENNENRAALRSQLLPGSRRTMKIRPPFRFRMNLSDKPMMQPSPTVEIIYTCNVLINAFISYKKFNVCG